MELPVIVLNNAPELDQADQNITLDSNENLALPLTSSDIDQHATSYTLLAAPTGAFIDSNDVLVWQPENSQTGNYHDFIISVVDSYG